MEIWAQNRLSTYFRERRHTALLIAIVVAFAIRPVIGDVGEGPIVFSLAMLALMLVALYTVHVDELIGEREARYSAVAEGISGQFYLAILVARLVGMQMSGAGRSEQE
jgi:hypothetical protein